MARKKLTAAQLKQHSVKRLLAANAALQTMIKEQAEVIKGLRQPPTGKIPVWMASPEKAPMMFTYGKEPQSSNTNPKTLIGQDKVPMLSVIPPASIIYQALAMRYGAFLAPRIDGLRGYGPYNWRDQPIEAHIYIDAAMRHLLQWQDGDDCEIVTLEDGTQYTIPHLGFALATIGILIDAFENETLIDDRPKVRNCVATELFNRHKVKSPK